MVRHKKKHLAQGPWNTEALALQSPPLKKTSATFTCMLCCVELHKQLRLSCAKHEA